MDHLSQRQIWPDNQNREFRFYPWASFFMDYKMFTGLDKRITLNDYRNAKTRLVLKEFKSLFVEKLMYPGESEVKNSYLGLVQNENETGVPFQMIQTLAHRIFLQAKNCWRNLKKESHSNYVKNFCNDRDRANAKFKREKANLAQIKSGPHTIDLAAPYLNETKTYRMAEGRIRIYPFHQVNNENLRELIPPRLAKVYALHLLGGLRNCKKPKSKEDKKRLFHWYLSANLAFHTGKKPLKKVMPRWIAELREAGVKKLHSVVYMGPKERKAHLIGIDQHGFVSQGGKLAKDGKYKFVISANGKHLYIVKPENFTLQHSSFFRGKPVQCAGYLTIKWGRLSAIRLGSGHYRPDLKKKIVIANLLRHFKLYQDHYTILDWNSKIFVIPKPYAQTRFGVDRKGFVTMGGKRIKNGTHDFFVTSSGKTLSFGHPRSKEKALQLKCRGTIVVKKGKLVKITLASKSKLARSNLFKFFIEKGLHDLTGLI